jgi:hypothetical protein
LHARGTGILVVLYSLLFYRYGRGTIRLKQGINSFYVQQQAFKYSLIRKTGYYVFPTTDLLTTRVPRGTHHPPPMITLLVSTHVTAVGRAVFLFVCSFYVHQQAFKNSLIRKTGYFVFSTAVLLTAGVPRGTPHPH